MFTLMQALAVALGDRYRVERELGRGGMATVFLAEDQKHGRRVAIKVLDPEVAAAIGDERFLREIEIVARLNHPHILPLHDSGAAKGQLYYVTPYIEGETLRARLIRERQLPVEDALRLTREIAHGLGHAHHRGLVHRDVKPENVLLSDGIALVSDFGIARPASTGDVSMTVQGAPIGTPLYMAPEQIIGSAEIDARADLYALGCVLYEMLAGRPPFTGTTRESLAYQHLSVEPQSVTEFRPDVPAGLDAVLMKALSKAPSNRFATAARFAEALGVATAETLLPMKRELQAVPNNLRRQRTTFVGREEELGECARLLHTSRLLTLVGVGGCGKTRLALRLGEDLLAGSADGVWFVDLAPVTTTDRVPQAVAGVLGVTEAAGTPLSETIARHLGAKRAFLLLDNCEHLLTACAELVDALLAACPELKVMATSREGLGVEGERTFAVPSLSVPGPDANVGLAAAANSESVRLFVERARVVVPGFELTSHTAPRIVEICRRLDGIPLAIELAAARTKMLSLEQICGKLDDRFRLLTGGNRALPRHQTLRATIQWSYDHLTPDMQQLFDALSVFSGGWTLAAAAAVVSDGADEFEILDLMTGLVDKSVLLVGREGRVSRYRMLETMRQFAQEHLGESGLGDDVRSRHLDFYVALVDEAESKLYGAEQDDWLRRLDQELENILAAIDWCARAPGGAEKALHLTSGMRLFWIARGLFALGLRTTRQALDRAANETATPARGRALSAAGLLAHRMGDHAGAQSYLEESVGICQSLGDLSAASRGFSYLGVVTLAQGDHATAHRHLEQAVSLAHGIDKATALTSLALVLAVEGDFEQATLLYEQALALSRELGSTSQTAATLNNLARTQMLNGDYAVARATILESLDIVEKASLVASLQGVLDIVAGLAAARGEMALAARLWGAGEALLERIGAQRHALNDRVVLPLITGARESLGDAAFASDHAAGRALSDEAAAAEARAWLAAATPPT